MLPRCSTPKKEVATDPDQLWYARAIVHQGYRTDDVAEG